MNEQTAAFLDSHGDHWYRRNKDVLGSKEDPVQHAIARMGLDLAGKSVLELGCADGWRLKQMASRLGCDVWGVDPSRAAIAAAGDSERYVVGVAQDIPFDRQFDVVILGHCMWVIEPEDWFKVVAETTRVLADGGLLIITDNSSSRAVKCLYCHDGKYTTYQFYYDWPKLWLAHSGYKELMEVLVPEDRRVCSVLRKSFNVPVIEDR